MREPKELGRLMKKFIPPTFKEGTFTCAHCDTLAMQMWYPLYIKSFDDTYKVSSTTQCKCFACNKVSHWLDGQLIHPNQSGAPLPHDMMPDDVANTCHEARAIVGASPRAAAALLRLALQQLCAALGYPGKNINDDIKAMVAKGLPSSLKKALDTVRVIGNNAVHPGEIDMKDNTETAYALFALLNYTVERMIAEPAKIDELFEALPEGAKLAIEKRDQKALPSPVEPEQS